LAELELSNAVVLAVPVDKRNDTFLDRRAGREADFVDGPRKPSVADPSSCVHLSAGPEFG